MEKWRKVWRELAKHMSTTGIAALRDAIVCDDPRLVQHCVCVPPPLDNLWDHEPTAACAIGYCAWQDGINSVRGVEEHFHNVCDKVDEAFQEPASARYFLTWFDDTPREEMRLELLPEVNAELERRSL